MQRRGPGALPPLAPTPAKVLISVEEWEAKAPLGPRQTRSVNQLKPLCEERPLPLKVRTNVLRIRFSINRRCSSRLNNAHRDLPRRWAKLARAGFFPARHPRGRPLQSRRPPTRCTQSSP